MKPRSPIAVIALLGLAVAACSSTETELSTTSSLIGGTTQPADPTTTTSTSQADTTPTTLRGEIVSDYDVVVKVDHDNGDVLYIVIPPGAYTDLDLEDFILDLRDSSDQLWGAEVFDDPDALMAFQVAEENRSEEEQQLLADHHLVSLVDGDTIRFQGPFSEFGEYVLAS